MNIPLYLLCFLISACAYQIRGGSRWYFSWYFKPDPVTSEYPDKVPGCRWIGDGIATFAFAATVIYYGQSLWLIPIFFIGWYLTVVFGWGDVFNCRTWKERIGFFWRMCLSYILFAGLSQLIMWGHNVPLLTWFAVPTIATFIFSLGTVINYTIYSKMPNQTDASFNWAEFQTGGWLYACTAAVTTFCYVLIQHG